MKILFFPFDFPPIKGGIATWMFSLCRNMKSDDITVFVENVPFSKDFDENQSFKILRGDVNKNLDTFRIMMKFAFLSLHILLQNRRTMKIASAGEIIKCIWGMNHKQFSYFVSMLSLVWKNEALNNIDCMFCGFAVPAGIPALMLKFISNKPYCVFVHGFDVHDAQKTPASKQLMQSVLKNSYRIIANSRYTKDLVESVFDISNKKITVVRPGVNSSLLKTTASNTSQLKKKLKLENQKILLTVANLVERKGHDMVIKSLPTVLKEIPDLKYLIVGDGIYRHKLMSDIQRLKLENHVIMCGKVPDPDLPLYYHLCDVYVMPGRIAGVHVEGFGIAYIEANACSKPVIGGRAGGVEDAVLDGQTGILVDPEDSDKIAEAISKLLTNPKLATELGENGRKRVEKELTWEICTQKIRKIAEEAVQSAH